MKNEILFFHFGNQFFNGFSFSSFAGNLIKFYNIEEKLRLERLILIEIEKEKQMVSKIGFFPIHFLGGSFVARLR